ncbi:MAG: hypothetical protein U9Q67_02435 [Patescibacteria group bacterium]|nr:hypothetical protein [Patescibacteria group bacterium]
MSRLETLRRLTWSFEDLWSIDCGMKPSESGLSSTLTERFHSSGLNVAIRKSSRV